MKRLIASAMLVLAGTVGATTASADQGAQRYEVKTSLSNIKAGGARTDVRAPIEVVRQAIIDFGSYAETIKKFEKARVVGRHGDTTDVYLQVPILKGAAKVWAVVRFEPKRGADGNEVIVGRMIKGNVKRLDASWHLKKIDDANTKLDLELLIVPDLPIPVPGSLVTGELSYAAEKAVKGMRSRSEQMNAR
jgi:ribosome-associated toxin RatA of RatAB toxin-antitoxin module